MSTPATTSSASPNTSAAARNPSPGAQRPGAASPNGSNVFSSLLDLLAATRDLPAADDGQPLGTPTPGLTGLGADTPADDPALDLLPDAADNPLAALLAWPGTPALLDSSAAPTDSATLQLTRSPEGLAAEAPDLQLQTQPAGPSRAGDAAPGTPLPPGMTALDQPAEVDAHVQASLARVGTAPANNSAGADTLRQNQGLQPAASGTAPGAGKTGPQPANWRSTTDLGQGHATSVANTRHALHVSLNPHPGNATAMRSTVTLDERFNAALTASTSPVAGAPGAGLPLAAMPGGESGTGQHGQGSTTALPEPGDAASPDAAEATFEALTDEEAAGLGAWQPQNLRQASLRVGEGGEEAIDIRLSLDGEALSVDFRTDNAEARASLQQNASTQLSDLLQRSGIQLGGVSVGAQQQGQGQPGQPGAATPAPLRRAQPEADGKDLAAPPAPLPPRSDGSRPLDMFV